MLTNKVACLFILHVLNNLDDTVLSKKKILQDILLTIDDNKSDECFAKIFVGIQAPLSKTHFTGEEIEAFEALKEHSSSKKDALVRRKELMEIVTKPLETFFEENMLYYLMDTEKSPLLTKTFAMRVELGGVKDSDAVDEMFRQIQKKQHIDARSQPLFGHPQLHRVLKDLVKLEQGVDGGSLDFSKQMASVLLKNLESCLDSRAVWILVALLEHERTKSLLSSDLQAEKHLIAIADKKQGDKSKGLQVLQKLLKEA
jgi:pumilio family protein 6